jgi:hypothetical protein
VAVEPAPDRYGPEDVSPAVRSRWQLGPLALLGYDPPDHEALPGEPLAFTLYWQAATSPRETYTLTTTLERPPSELVLALESGWPVHGAYPTDLWSSGEIVVDRHAPRLPRDIQPGTYNLRVTVTDPSGNQRSTYAGRVEVQALARDFEAPTPAHPSRHRFGAEIALAGYDFAAGGPSQLLTLYWQALAETETDYTVFVHLLDGQGQIAAQRDVQPNDGAYPTSLWAAGEYVSDDHPFTLPSGTYGLEVGLYLPETGETLGKAALGEVVIP